MDERAALDPQFEEVTVAEVGKESSGWSIKRSDGWSFFVPADSPVTPEVGMTMRFYGKGIGFPVRGLFLDGQQVFYRTEAEDRDHSEAEMYGATVDDLLAKWDSGRSIWSIERGGLGPGYEQCIQVMAVEFARACRKMPRTTDDEADYKSFGALCDLALAPINEGLGGVSGAQFGAAKWLAWQWCFGGGPMKLMRLAKEKGADAIQVSKHWPKAPTQVAA